MGAVLRQVSGSKGTGLTFADVACAMGKGKASPNVHTSAQDEPSRTEQDCCGTACPVGKGESPAASGEEDRLVGVGEFWGNQDERIARHITGETTRRRGRACPSDAARAGRRDTW